ncbi:MAG: hypothetical protein WC976_06210 [Caldisericia bacterium]
MSKKQKKIKIEIFVNLGPKKQDSFWYEGHITSVSRGDITIEVVAHGDIRIKNKKGELVHDGCKERGDGFPEFKHGLNTDKQLSSIEKFGYEWINNNWLECFVGDNGDAGPISYVLKDAIADAKEMLLDEEKLVRKEAREEARKKAKAVNKK